MPMPQPDVTFLLDIDPNVSARRKTVEVRSGTVVGHSVRVARANPIHALRYE